MREKQFKNVVEQNALYSQPISEGGNNWTSDPIKTNCVKVDGGWVINGFKKFASLAGHCDYYSIVCTEHFPSNDIENEPQSPFPLHCDVLDGISTKREFCVIKYG